MTQRQLIAVHTFIAIWTLGAGALLADALMRLAA